MSITTTHNITLTPSERENYLHCLTEIINSLIKAYETQTPINLSKIKGELAKKHKLSFIPKLVDIISSVPDSHKPLLLPYLKAKPVRTASGVAVVALMSRPHRCPHIALTNNVCVYCPGGPDSDFEYSTQAYTGYEPTSMRAIRARYHPYSQSRGRIDQLKRLGHNVDKVEFIVMGGTFMSLSSEYKDFFIRNLHDSLSGNHSSNVLEAVRYSEQSKSMKCIGITIETRPDYCLKPHLNEMLSYGCTRIEIGVQSIFEDVARDTNRGHTVKAVSNSFHLARDCGFKIVTHMMPDLPMMMNISTGNDIALDGEGGHSINNNINILSLNTISDNIQHHLNPNINNLKALEGEKLKNISSESKEKIFHNNIHNINPALLHQLKLARDLEGFIEFFSNPDFRPDGLKLYPTLVIRGTGLYELWKTGHYRNYTPNELIDLITLILSNTPPWTRIYRIQRDIPMPLVTSGVDKGNLRELALERMKELGLNHCVGDVRVREVGMRQIHQRVMMDEGVNSSGTTKKNDDYNSYNKNTSGVVGNIELLRRDYVANEGWETFLSYEDVETDVLIGLLRLRKLSPTAHRVEAHTHHLSGYEGMSNNVEKNTKIMVDGELVDCQCSIVRELHVYGSAVPLHSRDPTKFQHQGFGTLLMEEAERIAREEHQSHKLLVIAGVGTRHYYRKLGYEIDGPYMSKTLI